MKSILVDNCSNQALTGLNYGQTPAPTEYTILCLCFLKVSEYTPLTVWQCKLGFLFIALHLFKIACKCKMNLHLNGGSFLNLPCYYAKLKWFKLRSYIPME
jgi:hypothetical protein